MKRSWREHLAVFVVVQLDSEPRQSHDYCVAMKATLHAARPSPSLHKKRSLGSPTNCTTTALFHRRRISKRIY
jgi:hypothetical protein